jgi:transcriptional regulator with XRE-family HTH domain
VKNDLKTVFGKVLKELRINKGLTQQRLGDHAGIDRAYISELERGQLMPSMETVFRLAEILKVKPQQIIELVYAELNS